MKNYQNKNNIFKYLNKVKNYYQNINLVFQNNGYLLIKFKFK